MKRMLRSLLDTGTNAIGRIKYNRYKLLTFVLAALVIANALGITGWTVNTITGLEINLPELARAAGDYCAGKDYANCGGCCKWSGQKWDGECLDDCPLDYVCKSSGCGSCTDKDNWKCETLTGHSTSDPPETCGVLHKTKIWQDCSWHRTAKCRGVVKAVSGCTTRVCAASSAACATQKPEDHGCKSCSDLTS